MPHPHTLRPHRTATSLALLVTVLLVAAMSAPTVVHAQGGPPSVDPSAATRIDGGDAVQVAVAISRAVHADDDARHVAIARNGGQLVAEDLHYFLVALYFFEQDQPSRMDPDGDAVPCEEAFPTDEVAAFWS
jgi:hypothetical protein